MENPVSMKPRTTPKDFFLWVGAMAALYTSAVAFITLLFQYIDYAFPDSVTGAYYYDPYSGPIRFAMASLVVLFPTFLILMRLIRRGIEADATRADIWIRRWALFLTLFIAGITLIIDLITLINTFLGGELTTRFILKVAVVFLVIGAGFLHFLSDLWGYWVRNPGRARLVGYGAALAVAIAVISGFFIVGSPEQARLARFDQQKVADLQSIQWQVVSYWQQKQKLPTALVDLGDPISGFIVPRDPQSGESYGYRIVALPRTFEVCATFNTESAGNAATVDRVAVPARPIENENWYHGVGETCFERTIDPERYPPFTKQ